MTMQEWARDGVMLVGTWAYSLKSGLSFYLLCLCHNYSHQTMGLLVKG